MSTFLDLPPLIRFETYSGDWPSYCEALYSVFKKDFIYSKPTFRGRPIRLKHMPMTNGKEATFWHFIQTGEGEKNRIPDPRRCERIGWIRPIIEHAYLTCIKVWENERGNSKRVLLWLEEEEYLVVLDNRNDYFLPWTAYMVTEPHRKKKLRDEYSAYKNS